ncbi:hypothetical protein [Lentzea flava]|uniref:Uncharacterized protein n=1 Tax=Lentzea flava TaxID=103732 RepID=A0ABQ2V0P8_9PSEU|nr:hypothetical protein [Lentzea flava]MCP2202728.1 hypothetical protein [Lentzea flava]GGU61611.1 hypothetical protein GCM10010178_62220 [Lentzea flava]
MTAETRTLHGDALADLMGLLRDALRQEGVITLLPGGMPTQRGSDVHPGVLHLPETAEGAELALHLAQRLIYVLRGHTCDGSEETAATLAEELLFGAPVLTRPSLHLVHSNAGGTS